MGTSASSTGPGAGTPLVPSWIEPAPADTPVPSNQAPPPTNQQVLPHPPQAPNGAPAVPSGVQPQHAPVPALPPIEEPAEPRRFQSPRTNFSGYARTGAGGGLSRALRQYITRSSGGTRTAAHRMGVPRHTVANILGFTQAAAQAGTDEALKKIGLDRFVDKPVEEVCAELIDALCAHDGGSIDEGIARASLAEAFAEMTAGHDENHKKLTTADLNELVINFVAQSIRHRILNDIGTKAISLPANIADIETLQQEVYDLIKGSVRDAVEPRMGKLGNFTPTQLDAEAGRIYELALEVIVSRTEE